MKIEKIGNKITIYENIATISDVVKVKEILKDIPKGSSIIIFLKDSIALPSSFLGIILKFVQIDKTEVILEYTKDEIGYLLDEMNLADTFQAKKAEPKPKK